MTYAAIPAQPGKPAPEEIDGTHAIEKETRLPSAFRWLWGGQSISLVDSQLSALSIQIIAVKNLRADAMQMGLLTASQTIPYLLFSLFVGVLVDRTSRRRCSS